MLSDNEKLFKDLDIWPDDIHRVPKKGSGYDPYLCHKIKDCPCQPSVLPRVKDGVLLAGLLYVHNLHKPTYATV